MKRILLACGTAVATSTVVTNRLMEAMKKRGLEGKFTTSQCKIAEILSKVSNFDILVSNAKAPAGITIPVINGLPLLTGIGAEKVWDEIAELIRKE
ncbi:MAG: PTS sugar transporter subunit IIB [Treponema sp.]|jgi:PTS system galactitol-specific IIB component|nr:PTS sugar transporter subunit IIB [Treponema sp.]